MNNKLLVLIVFFGTICLLTSCEKDSCLSKNQVLNSNNSFTENLNYLSNPDLTQEMQKEFLSRYKNLINHCYSRSKSELSLEEKQEFWTNRLVSYSKLHDDGLMAVFDSENSTTLNNYVRDKFKQVFKESGQAFGVHIAGIMKIRLPDLIDNLTGELLHFNEPLKEQLVK